MRPTKATLVSIASVCLLLVAFLGSGGPSSTAVATSFASTTSTTVLEIKLQQEVQLRRAAQRVAQDRVDARLVAEYLTAQAAQAEAERQQAAAEAAAKRKAAPVQAQAASEPVVAASDSSGACWGLYDIVVQFWPDQMAKACAVIGRESHGSPTARNPSGASGVMQIMLPMHCHFFIDAGWSCSDWPDPYKNIYVGYQLYLASGGWGPWGG